MKVVSDSLRCKRWRQLYVFHRQTALIRRTPVVFHLHATSDVPPKSWTFNKTLIIQLSIVVSSVLYRAHSF